MVGYIVTVPWILSDLQFADDGLRDQAELGEPLCASCFAWSGAVEHGLRGESFQ